jgi:ATP-binding cassette subfamily B protein
MTPSAARATTKPYTLSSASTESQAIGLLAGIGRLRPVMTGEQRLVMQALAAVVITSITGLLGPLIIAHTVDVDIRARNFTGVLQSAGLLFLIYLCGLGSSYFQTQRMGTVGRRVLFNLRNSLFRKLQDLPVAFFNQNKTGDLISRINNDTDKLNQFFSQALVQFAAGAIGMTGAAIFLVSLSPRLGAAALLPAAVALIVTRTLSPWVKRMNARNLKSIGSLSGEIQESLGNFRVIVAFNRRDYFREKFDEANQKNYEAAVRAGVANNVFLPIYGLAHNLAQVAVLAYGVAMIQAGTLTVGVLIGFLLYVNSFYMPLRQLAVLWSSLQLALAAVDRISEVLHLEPDMPLLPAAAPAPPAPAAVLSFDHVRFGYTEGQTILRDTSFDLAAGKTYAFVGPTGGGKTTTASLMARLYDPVAGTVRLKDRDIRTVSPEDRAKAVGFILQDPFLFTGTVRDNIVYGHGVYHAFTTAQLLEVLAEHHLADLVSRFEGGLDAKVSSSGDGLSLGQKQIVAFMRAVLRRPDLLILDEATANIDTMTEQLLQQILDQLPASTTKVVIAHRLNTIANADEIFFVNSGDITPAGSMQHAVDMLMHGKRTS